MRQEYRTEMHTGLWYGNMKKREHLQDLAVDGR